MSTSTVVGRSLRILPDRDQIPKFFDPIHTYVEEVDWDAIKANPDIELWAIRIPHGVSSLGIYLLSAPYSPFS